MIFRKYILFLFLCVFFGKIYAQSDYVVEPFWINSGASNEIFSLYFRDGIIFCSDRRSNFMVNRTDTAARQLFNLYFAPADRSSSPNFLSQNIPLNSHKVSCTVSADGNEMYFAANDERGQRIFSARRSGGGQWAGIQPFAHNQPNFTTTHPSLSRCGSRLYFASDMPGGFGGFDIYVSERTPRGWGPPQNLGPEINTSGDELYPFIKGSGELYFSSTSHGSMGGLDIFSARELDGVWGFVQRLDEPINSVADDISYTVSDRDETKGFFASNRDGNTFNIYSFSSLFPVFPSCSPQEENFYTYIFEEAGLTPDTTTFELMWDFGDGDIKYGEEIWYTFPGPGQYEIILSVVDGITNEITNRVADYILDVFDIEQPYITAPDTIEAGQSVTFDAFKTYLPEVEIIEYYWMFGDGARRIGARTEHTFVTPGTFRVQLGVIGKLNNGEQVNICVYIDITVL